MRLIWLYAVMWRVGYYGLLYCRAVGVVVAWCRGQVYFGVVKSDRILLDRCRCTAPRAETFAVWQQQYCVVVQSLAVQESALSTRALSTFGVFKGSLLCVSVLGIYVSGSAPCMYAYPLLLQLEPVMYDDSIDCRSWFELL